MKDLAFFSKGSGYTKNDLISDGLPIILYGRLYTNYETVINDVDTFVKLKDKSVISEGNEVIVPSSGETAKDISRASVVVKPGIILGGDLNIIKTKSEIEPTFLALTISNGEQKKELAKRAQGQTIAHLHNTDLMDVSLSYPTFIEQARIGEFIKKIESIIALQQRKLEALKQLKKGFLQKMFPSEKEKVPQLRFAHFHGEWEQCKLKEVGDIQSGIGFPNKEQGGTYGIPFYKVSDMNNIGNENHMFHSNNYISQEQVEKNNWRPIVKLPAVIFAKVGAALMLNRKRFVSNQFLIDNNMMAYSFGDSWNADFGFILFQTLNLPKYAQVGALPSFNASDIESIKVMMPCKKEQAQIGNFFKQLDDTIAYHDKKLQVLSQSKKAFLQKMFV